MCSSKATDQTLVEKLNYHFGSNKHECYLINRNTKSSFTIHHYAGKVTYSALGFLEKNRDTLSDSVVDMFKHSHDDLIRLLFHGNRSDGHYDSYRGVSEICQHSNKRNNITMNNLFSFNIEQPLKKMQKID